MTMIALGMKAVRIAILAGAVGAVALITIDQLWWFVEVGLTANERLLDTIVLEVVAFPLLTGTAITASLPFSAMGGFALGCMVGKRDPRLSVAVATGIVLGTVAVLGAFAAVFYWHVCGVSHGLCSEDSVGWVKRVVQREFLEGTIYPRRLALSILIGAIAGGWAARRTWLLNRSLFKAQAAA